MYELLSNAVNIALYAVAGYVIISTIVKIKSKKKKDEKDDEAK